MSKILTGVVVSTAMQNTIVVEITRHVPHPLYKKLMKRSKKHKVDNRDQEVKIGQTVKIIETKPMSKGKHFKLFVAGEKVVKEVKAAKETAAPKAEVKPKKVAKKKEASK